MAANDQLDELRAQLEDIRKQVNAGALFQSLGKKLEPLISSVKREPTISTLRLPDDDDGIRAILLHLNDQLRSESLTGLSDTEVLQLVRHIGSPDPHIRDKGIYFLFNDLIQQHLLTDEQMVMIVRYLISDTVLFAHILEPENDAVYQRAFAVLLLSVMLYADRVGYHFLNQDLVNEIVSQTALYMVLETDTRGFIKTNGWAHAFTHLGNLLDELSERDSLTRADKLYLMAILIGRYKNLKGPLIFGESQRLAGYLARLTNKNQLYADYLLKELKRWRQELVVVQSKESQSNWNRIYNRGRLIEAMIIRNDFSDTIKQYLDAVIDFLD
ncbi:DUF2785 domain-containing protein [Secundilactobacillus silagei]|uniref:DUF2785 domain-containing protein n=1 Tax=Secundilactobacillus silagei JCM 19001 TaxID=1302250 RepID=A0A1Z5IH86_9LACO|nr:DUF2785 domain-containing protein [Secundilactobacillus silagei]TDG69333.1 hypothetical protein C5L25_000264 [Secundilactobacillus silagei JCM 19001]GAX01056.1 hypothetical protein IWT126_01081 [Secundilactobacillus silagei JCM 19001]